MSKSEIARLRQQIELESAAMKLALHGFAAVGKHEFISHKYDAIGKCQEQLERLVGEEKASDMTIESYNHILESDERDMHTSRSLMSPVPLRQLKTPPLLHEAKEAIREHGCEILEHADHGIVVFPEGTMQTEIFPRLYNGRHSIRLPDGFEMMAMYDRCREHSLLFWYSNTQTIKHAPDT